MGWMHKLNETGKASYLYCPFDSDDISALFPWLETDDESGRTTRIVAPGQAEKQPDMVKSDYLRLDLSGVHPHVPVYVIAHGNQGLEKIGSQNGEEMSAEELAQKMSALKKDHRVIKLFLCNVGLDLLQGQQGFGFLFWKAMHAAGYSQLWVVCYLGMTGNSGIFQASKVVVTPDNKTHKAHEQRIFIGPDGTIYKPGDQVPDLV